MNLYIEHLLKNIPHKPGVYRMKNQDGQILYIGKAKDLFKRVGSYFKSMDRHQVRTSKMVEQIADIEYTVASSELEALILETNLIKEHRPKYNILMKDDKNFAYIKITTQEDYPRIMIVRKVLKDKAKYFGPKTAASRIYHTLNLLRKIFPYRNCNLEIEHLGEADQSDLSKKSLIKVTKAGIKYPCLDLHIKRCVAPCIGRPSREEYRLIIDQIIDFLEGKYQNIVDQLKKEMFKAAQNKRYEQAAKLRDKILTIETIYQDQLASNPDHQNADIINYYIQDESCYFNLFQVREGKLIDQQNLLIKKPATSDLEKTPDQEHDEILTSFIQQFYSENTIIPRDILLPHNLADQKILQNWLSKIANHKVKIIIPQKGKNDKLLALSLQNAVSFAKQSRARWEGESKVDRQAALEKLGQLLNLPKIPKRLECYDISHLSGTHTVASMSVFENGFPKPDQYRHFKINLENAGSPDDFASMEEVILRRLKYLKPSIETKGITIKKSPLPKKKKSAKSKSTVNKKNAKAEVIAEAPIEKSSQKYQLKFNNNFLLDLIVLESNKLKTFLKSFPTPNEKFSAIIKKIIEKFETKRLYIQIPPSDLRQYETIGFQEVKIAMEDFPLEQGKTIVVFDKSRNFEDPSFKKIPDLIVIDGGKGQLSHACKAMKDHHLEIPIISLAKKFEEIFLPNQSHSIQLASIDQTRLMLQHLRDEAHRFAIEYNRKLRKKDYTSSTLEEIQGVGKLLTQKLLKKFGSVENLKNQPEEEIAKIVGTKVAVKIKSHLN